MSGPFALGKTAEIYMYGEDAVLKLFRLGVPLDDVEAEQHKARIAHSIGIPTPVVGEVVFQGGRIGLVFQRVDGVSVIERLLAASDDIDSLAQLMAHLHVRLHQAKSPAGLPAQREIVAARISRCRLLSTDERNTLLGALNELPSGESLCHGDFHPGNVMLTEQGPVVIDWLDASVGNPVGDVARTSLLFLTHMANDRLEPGRLAAVRRFHEIYIEQYKALNSGSWFGYEKWIPIMAAAKLHEGNREQETWLLELVRSELSRW